jgi:hypothetical protein
MHGPDQRPENLDADRGVGLFEIAPFAVEQILIGVRRIDGELVDIREIGRVDGVRPAQMLVMSVQHERRAGKESARDMPAFVALQHRLVPRDRPRVGLMRIDQRRVAPSAEREGATAAPFEPTSGPRVAEGVVDFLQCRVEAIKERRLEHETGSDVLAGERQQAGLHFIRVQRRVIIHTVGIGFGHRAHIGREILFVARIDCVPHAQQMDDIVGRRGLDAFRRRELPASRQRHILDSREIVFRMGERESERDVDVAVSEYMRHAEIVAHDMHVVARSLGDEDRGIGRRGLRDPVRNDDKPKPRQHDDKQRDAADFQITHAPPSMRTARKLGPAKDWGNSVEASHLQLLPNPRILPI